MKIYRVLNTGVLCKVQDIMMKCKVLKILVEYEALDKTV